MQTTYYELTVTLEDALVEFVADFIMNLYDEGVELDEGKIIIRGEEDLHFIIEALKDLEKHSEGALKIHYTLEEKENIDWIKTYQESVQPIEVGNFYIAPSWYPPREDAINITIDPNLAFGSGHHGTTYSCLNAIDQYVKPAQRVIDVGCGSGILGLACKKLGARVELCDTDAVSVQSTKENFALNHEAYTRLWEGSVNQAEGSYDIVIANIIVDVLKFIAKDLKRVCHPEGIMILSGILDKKESIVLKAYNDLRLLDRIVKDEWVTLVYKKENNG